MGMRHAIFSWLMLVSLLIPDIPLASSSHSTAPDFSLLDKNGKSFTLKSLNGEVVLINFWASWCAPCRQEMPLLDTLYKRYKKLGFTLLGVNVEEDPDKARKLLEANSFSFPILFDSKNEVSKLYNLVAMPSTVMVDRKGKIRFTHAGYIAGDESKYDKWIRELVRE